MFPSRHSEISLRLAQLPNVMAGTKMPQRLAPQLATATGQPPEGPQWIHEIKLDGYRMICHVDGTRVRFVSRNGNDWSDKLPNLIDAVRTLDLGSVVLDGEIVVLAADGTTSFQALQNAMGKSDAEILYYVFDVLWLAGFDLRKVPLTDRKSVLRELLDDGGELAAVRYCDHIAGQGPEVFRQAQKLGVEGIVSKRADRPYRAGRHTDWYKIKCLQRDEFVVGGYTPPAGSRIGFGALMIGFYDNQQQFTFAGKVGTGFRDDDLRQLTARLKDLQQPECPFQAGDAKLQRDAIWVRPELVAQVEYANWTDDGHIRHPSFQGLREDVDPAEVSIQRFETADGDGASVESQRDLPAAPAPKIRFTHPDRLMYPKHGIVKLDLATYYLKIADFLLPHVRRRPLTLVRGPRGTDGTLFYQKHPMVGLPAAVKRSDRTKRGESVQQLYIDDLDGLLSLVQFSVLELHIWNARIDNIDRPDRMMFDLDPDERLSFPVVVDAALQLREVLSTLGLTSFVKTTGGKGLHVVVPVVRRYGWRRVKEFATDVAKCLAVSAPKQFTLNPAKAARHGKIYIDVLRNSQGATAVAAYSTRARGAATVSLPVSWDDLPRLRGSDQFNIHTATRKVAARENDPWQQIDSLQQFLTAEMQQALRSLVK